MSPADAFEPLRFALERAGIRYAIGGSWASTAFGKPRFTNDVHILGEFTEKNLEQFLNSLPDTFYVDREEALTAIRHGRSFNAIYMPMAFKFDFFPAAAFALGPEELDRAIYLAGTGLTNAPAPFVTPEDILLAKLFWFRLGGETSEGGATYKASLGVVRTLSTAATCRARRSSCRLATCWRERLKKLRRGSRASRS